MPILNALNDFTLIQKELKQKWKNNQPCIVVSSGTCGQAHGSEQVADMFRCELKNQGLTENIRLRKTGCLGFCEREPLVLIFPEGLCYCNVSENNVADIVSKTARGEIVESLVYKDSVTGKSLCYYHEIPFYKFQKQIIFGNTFYIDPENIESYIAVNGYTALAHALCHMTPEEVIEQIKKAGLRGRGGGGFPAGRKWETCRNADGESKYVIANCDEGDPGAYMDRGLMEGNPHTVLEGLIIAGYAIGAQEGFIYVREEYPLALKNIHHAIEKADEYGFIGTNILDSGFDFSVEVHRGAGAFVSGESSALMSAIEGRVGEPRSKYVHTAEKGLWEKPTCLNNVETLANVPLIITRGADWFSSMGTPGSKGTKIFSLVGKVNNTGLVEVPMGTSIRDIIFKIGGGIRNGKHFKAVQTGGPSGGVIPAEYLDVPIDFDELIKLGSMMGSGGMIVMDEDTCMVDVAYYFIDFLCDESCGKCVPCREGLKRMREILLSIKEGNGKEEDLATLEGLAHTMKLASLCALGQTAANPVLSTLRYFRNEYLDHIRKKACPALVCKPLIAYVIEPEKCTGCMVCIKKCPAGAIHGKKKEPHVIDQTACTRCGVCFESCPSRFRAVIKVTGDSRSRVSTPERITE
jgi:NADH-quinone oxidoreductase subunit F